METLLNNKAAMIGLAVLAFLVAALLVLAIVRMLFGGRLRMPGGRARQARLGIVDAFDLDRQRQLIIVRRDNTEHLIMIGGPNDVLIESEIVRVEARDLRDARRDKPADALAQAPGSGAPGPNEGGRIPAPAAVEREPSFAAPVPAPAAPPVSPSLPEVTSPIEPVLSDAPPQPRAPTFPLPPRRPAPPVPERRPAPPLRLPDSVTRTDDIAPPPLPDAGAAPLPPSVVPPAPSPVPVETVSVADPAVPLVAPASTRPAPPLLKPRPPIRPLQRTTPQPSMRPPLGGGAVPGGPTVDPAVSPRPPQARPQPVPPQPVPPQAVVPPPAIPPAAVPPAPVTPPAPPPQLAAEPDPKDALESLEEEMAKLLGRGPGG